MNISYCKKLVLLDYLFIFVVKYLNIKHKLILKIMKKLFAFLAVIGMLTYGTSTMAFAEETGTTDTTAQEVAPDSSVVATETVEEVTPTAQETTEEPVVKEEASFHQQVKKKFIEGDPTFMSFVLIALILGLALAIERIIYLNLATTNIEKLLTKVEDALKSGGVEAAKEVCRNTRGPVASIFYQGLSRMDQGIEVVEKSVVAYGSVQMGLLEKGLPWIALFIALAPMLGFMGTVLGMITAFDQIEEAGDISPSLVAGGIKVALITTVSGLLVAMILQVFYNYIISKIDSIVNNMEDASVSLIDILVKHNK